MNRRRFGPAAMAGLVILLLVSLGTGTARADKQATVVGSATKALLFSSDGMRPDLMQRYAGLGLLPTYAQLLRDGVAGDNGMKQAFPPNTGVGWYSMATGAWPSEHGSTNNTFFRSGDTFSNRTSFSASAALQADSIAAAAERAGKKVAQIDWVAGLNAGITGPTVDFASFFSRSGVAVGQADASEQAGAASFGNTYQIAGWVPAAGAGWTNVPAGDPAAPAMEISGGWQIVTSGGAACTPVITATCTNPPRTYNVYAYDSVVNGTAAYDHVIVTPSGKNGAAPPALDLKVGDFKPIRLTGALGLIGPRAGQSAGQYVKLISLASNLSNFKLYTTSIARAQAKCSTAACNALPAGAAGEDKLEKLIADTLPPWVAADFAPLEGGIIDEETYVQQGHDLEETFGDAVLQFILGTLQPDTDFALVGYPVTDEFSHQFMGLVTPTDIDGNSNPCFDVTPKFNDVTCTGRGTAGRVAVREGFIRTAYKGADHKLALARQLLGGSPTTIAASDHGFAPQWLAVNAQKVLFDAKVHNTVTNTDVSLHPSSANAANCGAATTDLAKGCWAGGTIQVYVNTTLPAGVTYEAVRTSVINAFQGLTDPSNPSAKVVERVMRKEELRNVDGTDALHPNRSGDVVVALRPPYQSDAGTNGVAIALSHFFGQHGYRPDLVNLANNVNMHATFVAAGAGIRKQGPVKGVRAIDIAPTLSLLMGVPGPQNASGKILYNLFERPGQLKEITILDISDYHGQLVPLAEAADNLAAPLVNASFAIGGAAFLKPWFDGYRAEAAGGSITVAAGDSEGATPPISAQFGDKPTVELMNSMGFDADGLGNHNFDKGEQYLRNTLIPLAKFPFLSANIVDSAGRTPREWSPSKVFNFEGGKLGLIGFSNEDIRFLTFPGSLGPFHVDPATAAVNAEAARLKAQGVNAIVAMGHLGADGPTTLRPNGSVIGPFGPLLSLADGVTNVDAVIGDHTNFQVLERRPNGVLVTENLSKGVRFTRLRLVIDTNDKTVVYKTADFHKPWTIGVTANAAIQKRLDELNAIIAPILGVHVASSATPIPRSDSCGRADGRLCESKIGDVITDSMRTAFKADFPSFNVDFAITNSGGIRDSLTCPTTDLQGDFCLASLYPFAAGVFPITKGQVVTVLPFGNVVATAPVTGVQLKEMLENGVANVPGANGRFAQVSGLCFTYDISRTARTVTPNPVPGSGDRVTSVVRANPDGTCTATPVGLTSSDHYTVAVNDFMAFGGDAYPNLVSALNTPSVKTMDSVLEAFVAAKSPPATSPPALNPVIQGRITCVDGNGATAPNCSTVLP